MNVATKLSTKCSLEDLPDFQLANTVTTQLQIRQYNLFCNHPILPPYLHIQKKVQRGRVSVAPCSTYGALCFNGVRECEDYFLRTSNVRSSFLKNCPRPQVLSPHILFSWCPAHRPIRLLHVGSTPSIGQESNMASGEWYVIVLPSEQQLPQWINFHNQFQLCHHFT